MKDMQARVESTINSNYAFGMVVRMLNSSPSLVNSEHSRKKPTDRMTFPQACAYVIVTGENQAPETSLDRLFSITYLASGNRHCTRSRLEAYAPMLFSLGWPSQQALISWCNMAGTNVVVFLKRKQRLGHFVLAPPADKLPAKLHTPSDNYFKKLSYSKL